MESGDTSRASAKSARKRNRKSRANREPASASGASGSIPTTASAGGNALCADVAGVTSGAPAEAGCLVIDVVCGVNRAKLRVDGLRNGSKTPCVYMETNANELGEGQSQGQDEGKDQTRNGELCLDP